MDRNQISSFDDLLARSTDDIEWFWSEVDKDLGLEWFAEYDQVLDIHKGIEWATWFSGGRINLTHNCVDRHVSDGKGGKTALIWEGEDGEIRSLTYAELGQEVGRLANGLRSLGIGKGDAVGVYMPMTLEAVVAMLAIAKIGAI